MMRPLSLWLLASAVVASLAPGAFAGQVRVDVSNVAGAHQFFPYLVTINRGDHVVWVWRNGSHSVTSGDSALCGGNDGAFDSGNIPINISSGTAFTWKSLNAAGQQRYYCIPHCDMMAGRINIVASGAAVADFRITEVEF